MNPGGQSKTGSLVESLANIVIGIGVAFLAQEIIFRAYGYHVSYAQNAQMTAWFTAISLARQFVLRRLFNAISMRKMMTILAALFLTQESSFALDPKPLGGYRWFTTALGDYALSSEFIGWHNTAIGFAALSQNTFGSYNTALGSGALTLNTSGSWNTALGLFALNTNDNGAENCALGAYALLSNVDGFGNVAVGSHALFNNDATLNTALGYGALQLNYGGGQNVAVGAEALGHSNGGGNTAVGAEALKGSDGSFNIALGASAGINVMSASNVICIGSQGQDIPDSIFIANIFGARPQEFQAPAQVVIIGVQGQVGTLTIGELLDRLLAELRRRHDR